MIPREGVELVSFRLDLPDRNKGGRETLNRELYTFLPSGQSKLWMVQPNNFLSFRASFLGGDVPPMG